MNAIEKLEYGRTYHIYNRGINSTNLFLCQRNYEHFLELYAKYIHPIADTYAWVLLKNHFHLLVRIKEEEDMPYLSLPTDLSDCVAADSVNENNMNGTLTGSIERCQVGSCQAKKANPTRQFSHLFNGYARYFNLKTNRHGALFERPFKRIKVDNEKYFCRLVNYIHYNPVKHGLADHILHWGWSSYLSIISVKPTRVSREMVLGYFDNRANFIAYHQQQSDLRDIENLLLE